MAEGSDRKIAEVYAGSPGEKAGVKAGDIVLMVGADNTSGMENTAIAARLISHDETTISIEREGVEKKMAIKKIPFLAFGSKCVSGDCVNGKGKLLLPRFDNNQLEGNFQNGEPKGDFNIYNSDGFLWYSGNIRLCIPEGNGTRYKKDASGKSYKAEVGRFDEGILAFGSAYNAAGEEISNGSFSRDSSGRFIGGYTAVTYRGKKAWLLCDDMSNKDASGNSVCEGWAIVREGDPYSGKALAHTKYVGGKRDSMCREWDRENGLIHVIDYKHGVLDRGEIIRLADKKYIASNVIYATAYHNDPEVINHIVMGDFKLGTHLRVMASDSKGADFKYFKDRYVDESVGNPFAHLDNVPNPYKNNSGQNNQAANSQYKSGNVSACEAEIRRLSKKAATAASYYRAAYEEEKGYKGNRLAYEGYQTEIINDCDKAIAEYDNQVPSDLIYELKEIRSTLKSHNLGLGIMRNMPVLRE